MHLIFRYLIVLCFTFTQAIPVLEKRASNITPAQFSQFQLFAQYAGSAYCYYNTHGTGKAVSCAANGGSCPTLEAAQTNIIEGFSNAGSTNTTGYIATDFSCRLIIVSIQGTCFKCNFDSDLTDLDIIRVSTNLCGSADTNDGCEVHQGFWRAAMDVQSIVFSNIAKAVAANPGYRIVATGHSLGGAVAALLGTMLRNSGYIVDIYTFGQPHLGSVDISNYIQSQSPLKGHNYRITHYNDVVPQLPEHKPGDWDHYYPEFWIDKQAEPITISDVKTVDGSLFSTAGNEGTQSEWGILWSIFEGGLKAHYDYFGNIATCDPDLMVP